MVKFGADSDFAKKKKVDMQNFSEIFPAKNFKMSNFDVKSEFLKLTDFMTYFFVSRPTSGRREGFEYQRVMYFNPETEESSKQVIFFIIFYINQNSTDLDRFDWRSRSIFFIYR